MSLFSVQEVYTFFSVLLLKLCHMELMTGFGCVVCSIKLVVQEEVFEGQFYSYFREDFNWRSLSDEDSGDDWIISSDENETSQEPLIIHSATDVQDESKTLKSIHSKF